MSKLYVQNGLFSETVLGGIIIIRYDYSLATISKQEDFSYITHKYCANACNAYLLTSLL